MPRAVDRLAENERIGTRKVDVFEDAHRMFLRRQRMRRTQTVFVDHDHFARLNVANIGRVDQIEGAGFRGDHPGVAQTAQRQRPKTTRVANRNQLLRRQVQH